MDEQMTIDQITNKGKEENEENPLEREAFEVLLPELADILHEHNLGADAILFTPLKDKSSIYLIKQSSLIFGIRMRKNTWYAAISEWFAEYLPERAEISRTVSEGGVVRVKLSAPQDILICKDAIRESLRYQISRFHTFDCCGRFEQCSDALRCLHPDPEASLGCSYKRNLLSGKIFYGKNKNIP